MTGDFLVDWVSIKQRHLAWWRGEGYLLQIVAPKKQFDYPPPRDLLQFWADPQYVVGRSEEYFNSTYFLGDAFPYIFVNLGPSIASAYLGCPLVLQTDTTWQKPIVENVEELLNLRFDPENQWWRRTLDIISYACQRSKGRFIVSFTDLGGVSDILSHLCGPDKLCIYMLEYPEIIKNALNWIADLWFKLYEEQYEIIKRYQDVTCGWLSVCAPGRTYPLQEDFSCMISQRMFREFLLPHLEKQTEFLDFSIYHLDGPGAIQHLDALLELPHLHAIQWVPGAGAPPMVEWIPLLKRIQSAGKNIVIDALPQEVESLFKKLDWRGFCVRTWCGSREEGERLLKTVEKLLK
ncbi:MAG: hypothetical protein ACPLPS_03860 [bacterium]